MLVALLLLAAISAFAAGPPDKQGRELGSAIARKLRCAPRLPGPCWRDPLTEAYGRPVAGLFAVDCSVTEIRSKIPSGGTLPVVPPLNEK